MVCVFIADRSPKPRFGYPYINGDQQTLQPRFGYPCIDGDPYGGTGTYYYQWVCRGTPATRSGISVTCTQKLVQSRTRSKYTSKFRVSEYNVVKMERNTINLSSLYAQPYPPIRRKKAPNLTRNQKHNMQLLRPLSWKYDDIHKFTGFEISQIQYACSHSATPKKNPDRPPVLSQAQVEELIDFVRASIKNRQMSYTQLASTLNFGVKEFAIRTALQREGFHRQLAMRKPSISEQVRQIQLKWAEEHVNWTMEQWYNILWTDETWVTAGRYIRTWVTRKVGEEWDSTYIVERHQRKKG